MRCGLRNTLAAFVLWLLNCGISSTCMGADPPPAITLQRIAIPDGRIEEIPGELLPVERSYLKETLEDLNRKYRTLYAQTRPHITRARYFAKLENQQLIGRAELEIKHLQSETARLVLNPMAIAAEQFAWKHEADRPANVGRFSDGSFGITVTESGTLTFQWSLLSSPGRESEKLFDLALPYATTSDLELTLSSDLVPNCANAIVTEVPNGRLQTEDGEQLKTWRLEFGSISETELRIESNHDERASDSVAIADSHADYRLHATGMELQSTHQLQFFGQVPRKLSFRTDSTLQLGEVKLGDRVLKLTQGESTTNDQRQYFAQVPNSVLSGLHELSITAYAPIIAEQLWKLPTVQLDDVAWRQGTASLQIVEPLEIRQLAWPHTVLRSFEPLPSPSRGETRSFSLLQENSPCKVFVSRQPQQLIAQSVTSIQLGESNASSHFAAKLNASHGDIFSVNVQSGEGWGIDSIETVPPLVEKIESTAGTDGSQRQVTLLRPITPTEPITLIVKSQRRLPNTGPLKGDAMRPVKLLDQSESSRLTAVRAEQPLQLDVFGDASVARATELTQTETDLLDTTDATLMYRDGPHADRLNVVTRSLPPRFNATVDIEATVQSDQISQQLVFRCVPLASRIGSLRVRFSPPQTDEVAWSTVGDGSNTLAATQVEGTSDEWEVHLRRTRSVPFEIRAVLSHSTDTTRSASINATEPIILASLPDAESQSGSVAIRTTDGTDFSLDQRGLTSVPPLVIQPTTLQSARARFRYAPAQESAIHVTRHRSQSVTQDAWIWESDVTSRIDVSGDISHSLRLRVENVGLERMRMQLPANVSVEYIDVNDKRVATALVQSNVSIPLESTQRFQLVNIRCTTSQSPLGTYTRRGLDLPTFDLHTVKRSWKVLVPPGYDSTIRELGLHLGQQRTSGTRRLNWEQRLLGYEIVRKSGVPWNPMLNTNSSPNQTSADQTRQTEVASNTAQAPANESQYSQFAAAPHTSDWSVIEIPPSQKSATVLLHRSDMASTLGWALLFVAVACGLWLGERGSMPLCVAIVTAIVFVLLLPSGFVFLVRSVLFGLLIAVAFRVSAYPKTNPVADESPDDSMSFRLTQHAGSVSATCIVILVLHLALSTQPINAQETNANQDTPQSAVFNLYDPVDEEGVAVGRDVYISPKLFELVESLKMRLNSQQAEALLTKAIYTLPFEESVMATLAPTVIVEYELFALTPGTTTIQLPFNREEVQVMEASFDGQRIYPRWNSNGDSLQTDVVIANRHVLQFHLRPKVSRDTERMSLDIHIPKVADSQLTISGIDGASTSAPSAIGSITQTNTSLHAKLGPTDRLQITWPTSNASSKIASSYTSSQLTWVHAEANLFTVHTQFSLTVLSGDLDAIDLHVDRRLKFLPESGKTAKLQQIEGRNDDYLLHYPLDRTYEQGELVAINLNFLIPDLADLKDVQGSLVRLAKQPAESSQLAISKSQGLITELNGHAEWTPVAAEDFADTWGASKLPEQVFRLPSEVSTWSLTTAPLISQMSTNDSTRVRIGRRTADIRYHSELQVSDASISQIVLTAPTNLRVTSVAVRQKGLQTIQHRFAQTPDGTITVFLNNLATGDIDLDLEGSLSITTPGKIQLENIRVQGAITLQHKLTIVRAPEILVNLSLNQASDTHQEIQEPDQPTTRNRIVDVIDLVDENLNFKPNVAMEISRNPARSSARLMTTVQSQPSSWSITTDLSLKVEQGTVDSLRIRMPIELVDSLKLDPSLPFTLQNVPGQSEPTITVVPPSAIDKELQLKLTADLPANADGSIAAPSIELLDATVERYLALPKRSGDQEIDWDIRGLEKPQSSNSHTTYRVRRRRMAAVVREVKQAAGRPRLLLTDIQIHLHSNLSYSGIANYDVVPGALQTCDLVLPSGVELIHVTVDDVPALISNNGDATTIELQAERLPQRIAVLFNGKPSRVTARPNAMSIAAPTLKGLEPQSTLWSIRDVANNTRLLPLLDHAIVDTDAVDRIRGRVIDEALAHAAGPASQLRANDIAPWKTRWEQRRLNLNETSNTTSSPAQATMVSLQAVFAAEDSTNAQQVWTRCSFEGATPQLTVVPRTDQHGELIQRIALAISICLGAWFVTMIARIQAVRDAITRWPYLPGVLLGIVWWLWLSPSIVGWLIIAVVLVGALRPAWQSRPAG